MNLLETTFDKTFEAIDRDCNPGKFSCLELYRDDPNKVAELRLRMMSKWTEEAKKLVQEEVVGMGLVELLDGMDEIKRTTEIQNPANVDADQNSSVYTKDPTQIIVSHRFKVKQLEEQRLLQELEQDQENNRLLMLEVDAQLESLRLQTASLSSNLVELAI